MQWQKPDTTGLKWHTATPLILNIPAVMSLMGLQQDILRPAGVMTVRLVQAHLLHYHLGQTHHRLLLTQVAIVLPVLSIVKTKLRTMRSFMFAY